MTGQDTPGQGTAAQILDPETLQMSYLLLQLRILVLLLQQVLYVSGVHRTISEIYKCTYLNTGQGTQENSLGTHEVKAIFKIHYIKRCKKNIEPKSYAQKNINLKTKASVR